MAGANETFDMSGKTLGQTVENSVKTLLGKVIMIVCIESVLIAGIMTLLYVTSNGQGSLKEYTKEVDKEMQSKKSALEAIAAGISSGKVEEYENVLAYVDSMVSMDDQISAVYSCYDENITVMSGGWIPPDDFVVTEREWYIKAQENPDEVYVSAPYVDLQSGGICITLAKATFKDGKMMGVVGMDMYMDDLVSMMERSYKGSSYVFLTTSDGVILTHPDKKFALSAEKESTLKDANKGRYEKLTRKNMKTKVFLDYKGGWKFGISSTSQATGWKVIAVHRMSTLLLLLGIIIIINCLVCLITKPIARKVCEQKLNVLFMPLESISDKVTRIAEGDLAVQFDEEANSLEIDKLTTSLNETIGSLDTYIGEIENVVTAISDKDLTVSVSDEFKGSYVQIKESLERIVDSLNVSFAQIKEQSGALMNYVGTLEQVTQTVAEHAQTQKRSVTEIAGDMEELTDHAKQITERAGEIKDAAELTNTHLAQGTVEMKELVKAIDSIEACYSKIADFVGEINEIAAQTNLLSLNASIEAARAGEAGKGFAVVASEISALADSSSKASESINRLIGESRAAVNQGKELATSTYQTIEQGMTDSENAKQSIDNIVLNVENQQRAIQNINSNMEEITSAVKENAVNAQECITIAGELNNCAVKLRDTADSFALKE